MKMSQTWSIAIAVIFLLFIIQTLIRKRNEKPSKLPPGPRGFPILGCLHMLGKFPHRTLHKWSQKYMSLRLGLKSTIVVSSPQAAEMFLRNHDQVFANRPPLLIAKLFYAQKDVIFSPYGPHWRNLRKMCTSELLNTQKINSFKSMRTQELGLLIESLKQAACSGVPVDLSAALKNLKVDMVCKMLFGKKYKDDIDQIGFQDMLQRGLILLATPNIADYIPQLTFLDVNGHIKQMKALFNEFDDFFEKIIAEHVESRDENKPKDFLDMMLGFMGSEYRLDRDTVKAMMLILLGAAIDPVVATLEWALSELVRHPWIMKKLQKEIDTIVGLDRMVDESDSDKLQYLEMVIKETMRFHPISPLLVPHASMEDCMINGFHIPKQSTVLFNTYTVGRDSNNWNHPEKFIPDRFAECNTDYRGHDFELIPFGAGRRICAGMQLAVTEIRIVLAQLVHSFDWELPDGIAPTELDMTEVFSQVIFRAKPLSLTPKYRLNV